MLMKRKYDANKKVIGIKVDEGRVSDLQNFSTRIIGAGQKEGWLILSDNEITIKCTSGINYIYDIIKHPFKYCRQCDHETDLIMDQTGEQMRMHIVTKHNQKGDYDVINAYECKLRGEK